MQQQGISGVQLGIGLLLWVVFGLVGFLVANARGANPLLGMAMTLLCGLFGLFFVMRLPPRDSPNRMIRSGPYDPDPPETWTISPEVAQKLGLPPQQPKPPPSPPTPWVAGTPPPYHGVDLPEPPT